MVLGNGKVIYVSPDSNRDLFWGTACSYGSLGIITLIKLRLIQAKSFVRLNYQRVNSIQEAVEFIEKAKKDVDFLDVIMFGRNLGVVMFGYLTDLKHGRKKTFQKFYNEWFYLHAEKMVKKTNNWQEIIPVRDYLFRYNRGLFWLGKYACDLLRIPFNRLTRLLLDPFFRTRTVGWLVQATNLSQKYLVQDICVPVEKTSQFFDFVDKRFGIYPLWIMPAKPAGKDEKLCPNYMDTKLMIDIGIWGGPVGHNFSEFLQANRDLEMFTKELGGRKVLYAHAYYPEEEFWEIYDKEWYEVLRSKYHADRVFPDIYAKTNVTQQYQISAKRELVKLFKSPFRLPVTK